MRGYDLVLYYNYNKIDHTTKDIYGTAGNISTLLINIVDCTKRSCILRKDTALNLVIKHRCGEGIQNDVA